PSAGRAPGGGAPAGPPGVGSTSKGVQPGGGGPRHHGGGDRAAGREGGAARVHLERVAEVPARLERELAKAIVGQQRVVREILIAFLAGGHCLLRGVPGLAKTLLIKKLAEAVDLKFNRIQFTPDLMPS